jgi:lipoprotein-releasing system ATP-binding protein
MEDILLQACDIHKSFDDNIKILNGINLDLKKGESIAIMGASGEGKTTLLHILGGLETLTAGHILIKGEKIDLKNGAKFRNLFIGYIFQTYNLLEDLSLIDNILMPAKIARKYQPEMKERAFNLLKEINLDQKADQLARVLSGGEKQRAAIARSFCNDPEIILADEPSGNLDHASSKVIHQLLISFVKKKNKSLIVATHDAELAALCDKKILLKEGLLYEF